jgi:hypothetical protein
VSRNHVIFYGHEYLCGGYKFKLGDKVIVKHHLVSNNKIVKYSKAIIIKISYESYLLGFKDNKISWASDNDLVLVDRKIIKNENDVIKFFKDNYLEFSNKEYFELKNKKIKKGKIK